MVIMLDLEIDRFNTMLIISKPKELEDENYVKKIKAVADALDIDFLPVSYTHLTLPTKA